MKHSVGHYIDFGSSRSRAEKSPVIVREIDLNCCSYFVNGETILTNSKSPGSLGKNWAVGSVIDLEQ